jgi:hypothetical protein
MTRTPSHPRLPVHLEQRVPHTLAAKRSGSPR